MGHNHNSIRCQAHSPFGLASVSFFCTLLIASSLPAFAQRSIPSLLKEGQTLLDDGKNAEAVTELQEYVRQQPNDDRGYVLLGIAYAETSRLKEAEDSLRQAIVLAPDSPRAHLNLGVVEALLSHPDAAEKEFKRVLEIDPDHKVALYNLGKMLFEQHRYSTSLEYFKRYVSLAASDLDAWQYLVRCAIQVHDTPAVIRAEQTLLKGAPHDGLLHGQLGKWLAEGNYTKLAENEFTVALRLSPTSFDVRYNYAALLYDEGRPQSAIAVLSGLSKEQKQNATGHHLMGSVMSGCSTQRTPTLNTKRPSSWIPRKKRIIYLWATLLLSQELTSAAQEVFETAVKRAPEIRASVGRLGVLAISTGDIQDAMRNYQAAIAIEPGVSAGLQAARKDPSSRKGAFRRQFRHSKGPRTSLLRTAAVLF